jgi:hypothetical protein
MLERAAVHLAIVAVTTIPLLLGLHAIGRDGTPVAIAALLAAALASAWASWIGRPTPLDTAQALDAQHRLADLLSTAARIDGADPWQRAVRAQAAIAARSIAPSSLAVRRLTPRGWGGVGAALGATLLTFGVLAMADRLVAMPVDAARSADRLAAWRALGIEPDEGSDRASGSRPDRREPRGRAGEATSPDASRVEGVSASADDSQPRRRRVPDVGGGFARADDEGSSRPPPMMPIAPRSSDPSASSDGRGVGDGPASRGEVGPRQGLRDPAGVVRGRGSGDDEPWTSDAWGRASEQADAAIRGRQVPASSADVVRRYFRRDR